MRLTLFKLYIPYESEVNLIIYKAPNEMQSPNQQSHEWCAHPHNWHSNKYQNQNHDNDMYLMGKQSPIAIKLRM